MIFPELFNQVKSKNLLKKGILKIANGNPVSQIQFKIKSSINNNRDNNRNLRDYNVFRKLTKYLKSSTLKDKGFIFSFTYEDKIPYNVVPFFQTLDEIQFKSFYSLYDTKKVENIVTEINVYYVEPPKNISLGGLDDKYNDCLFYALSLASKEHKFNMKHKNPSRFKTFLNLQRDEKIDVDLIQKVEEKYKINIIISGDVSYDSLNIPQRPFIPLLLLNNHYTYKNKPKFSNFFYKYEDEVKIIVFADGKYYDGVNFVSELPKNIQIIVKGKNETFEETYKQTMKEYEEIKNNFDYNPFKYNKLTHLVKNIILDVCGSYDWEDMTLQEQKIIQYANMGGLHYSTEKGKYKNIHYLDINRYYPFLESNLNIPLKSPSFEIIDEIPTILRPSFFRCEIIGDVPFFKRNIYDWYSHYTIKQIKETSKAEVKLIQDGKINFLNYPKEYFNMNKFNTINKTLYDISKKSNNKTAKMIANLVWGCMSSKDYTYSKIKTNEENIMNYFNDEIVQKKSGFVLKKYNPMNIFKYSFARIGPIITARGRMTIAKKALEFGEENIIYINTDGMITKTIKKINGEEFTPSDKIGGLRIDKQFKKIKINGKKYTVLKK